MLSSKERAALRSQATELQTLLIVGKGGITENLIQEAETLLTAKELVKGKVLETSLLSPQEALEALCEATGADPVQTVGTKFVLYRRSEKLHQKPQQKKKVNPVRVGRQARRAAAREERERRNEYFRQTAIQNRKESNHRKEN
ncbi:MAG: YhbY family RNA-binding protein [Oscillospiraceae bacterium]|nr:YhbY family RNA-binding protein [Oscillospiraceae bacterium]